MRLNPGSRIFSGLADIDWGCSSSEVVISGSDMMGAALSSVRAKVFPFFYSQASQCSGFSREQASASSSLNP